MESVKYHCRYGYFYMSFKIEILANFVFCLGGGGGGINFANKLFIKLLNFIPISN